MCTNEDKRVSEYIIAWVLSSKTIEESAEDGCTLIRSFILPVLLIRETMKSLEIDSYPHLSSQKGSYWEFQLCVCDTIDKL